MSNVPITPADDGYGDNPVIATVVAALTGFAVDGLTRENAVLLLAMWRHGRELTDREIRAVLRRFPLPDGTPPESWLRSFDESDAATVTEIPNHVEGNSIGSRTARCEHCQQWVRVAGGRYTNHTRPNGEHCRDSGRPLHR